MNDKLKEKIDLVIALFENANKNSFIITCGCNDYCECYYNSAAYYDDDMSNLQYAVKDLKKFLAENLAEE